MAKAFILVNCEVTRENAVLEILNKMEEVTSAFLVYGIYDIIASVEGSSFDEIKSGVLENIRGIKDIQSTVTMVVADET